MCYSAGPKLIVGACSTNVGGGSFLYWRHVLKKSSKPGELGGYNIGDKIVYPGHGVAEINNVQVRMIGGSEHAILNMTVIESGMKVIVPVAQANTVGIRKVVDKKAVDKVYQILKKRDYKIDTQTWNRRFREYSQKIKTGSVFEIAEVLRDLSVLSVDKQLSFSEKRMLDTAQSLLVSEISIAKARSPELVMGELREIFA
jgi:CarD family transcriptional regulator